MSDKTELPPVDVTWGNPADPFNGWLELDGDVLPLRITVDKTRCRVAYRNETEAQVTIVIERRTE